MKPENPTKTEGQRWGNLFRVAIVGAATLKGKELKEVLEEKNFPAMDIRLLDDDESLGQLDQVQDEVSFIQPVTREQLENTDFTFFASDETFTRLYWKLARDAGSAIVDLSYALDTEMKARRYSRTGARSALRIGTSPRRWRRRGGSP